MSHITQGKFLVLPVSTYRSDKTIEPEEGYITDGSNETEALREYFDDCLGETPDEDSEFVIIDLTSPLVQTFKYEVEYKIERVPTTVFEETRTKLSERITPV